MKKLIAILLVITLLVTSCAPSGTNSEAILPINEIVEAIDVIHLDDLTVNANSNFVATNLGDPNLLRYIEDSIFENLIPQLDSDAFFIENITAVFLSNEYFEQLAFNSLKNIYFGYTLAELDEIFQGTRYVFTLDEDGQTTVQTFEQYDDTCDRVVRNLAIGTGVILLAVTIGIVAPVLGAPVAITTIFSIQTITTPTIVGALSGGIAGVVVGITTGDIYEALTAAAIAGSEGFKWAAISAPVIGGVQYAAGVTRAARIITRATPLSTAQRDVLRRQAQNIVDVRGISRTGREVHHIVPLEHAHRMGPGFNPNDARNLAVVDPSVHTQITARWNTFRQVTPNPTQQQIISQVNEINSLYGHLLTFLP